MILPNPFSFNRLKQIPACCIYFGCQLLAYTHGIAVSSPHRIGTDYALLRTDKLKSMKKILFAVCATLLLSASSYCQSEKFKTIVGQWDFTDQDGTNASLTIVDTATIILTYMGEQKKIVHYKMDFSRSPHWFDFSTEDSTSTVEVKSLFQLVNDDVIKWQLFVDEERSPHFTARAGELFYLKRSRPDKGVVASSHQ